MMKRRIFAISCLLMLAVTPLSAGPFISINSVDAKSDFPRIKLSLTVVDPDSRGIPGLDEENILVHEDGYRVNYAKVKDVSSSSDPLYLVFAIDSSKSISSEYLEKIKRSAGEIADSAGSNDRILVLKFNDAVKLLNNFTSNRMEIVKSIKSVERHGSNTVMNDAIYDSIEFLSRVKSGRKAVIVFTDGKDEKSALLSDDIIKSGKEKGVPVHFITSPSCKNPAPLGRIAKLTGGVLISCGDKSVTGIYRIILSRLKNTYEVVYQSIVKRDNGRHQLEVRLKYGELKDRDTAEYVAGWSFFGIDLPGGNVILSLLVFILIGLMIAVLVLLIKKNRGRIISLKDKKSPAEYQDEIDPGLYTGEISVDDLQRPETFDEDTPSEAPDVMYTQVWLQHKDDHGSGEKFQMIKSEITIGSGEDNAIEIEDISVSKKHARIRRIEGGYYLYDLVSDTGTYLNGKKLLRPKLLHDWDEITVGSVVLIFRAIK